MFCEEVISTTFSSARKSHTHTLKQVRYDTATVLHDYTQAVVAFVVAGASSYYLAQLFPFLSKGLLPLITGYLFIGIIVGPFVTHLITAYVDLLCF